HRPHALLDDEQSFADLAERPQVRPDLLDAILPPQVGIHHEDRLGNGANAILSEDCWFDVMQRLQQSAHLPDLVGLVGEKVHMHDSSLTAACCSGARAYPLASRAGFPGT